MLILAESRQVRRARERADRERRFYRTHPDGNRATRLARGRRVDSTSTSAVHPTKGRKPPSERRQRAQLGMVKIFALAARRLRQARMEARVAAVAA